MTVFICCGDALFDMFSQSSGAVGTITLNGHVGGSPLNVASGLARLGHKSGYLCKNSTDIFGVRIAEFLAQNQVDTQWLLPTDLNSTLAVIETDDNGVPHYVFYTDNTADLSMTIAELPATLPAAVAVLHFGSYSTGVDPTASTLLHLAQRESSQRMISYDPNIRPTIEPDIARWQTMFSGYAACADLIKASDEDIETLFGKGFEQDNFAADALAKGAQLVLITRGSEGASAYTADGRQARVPGVSVKVADTVGAGDTFQAASLHWLYERGLISDGRIETGDIDLSELLQFAAQAAAITCTRHGADLPTLDDIVAYQAQQ